LADIYNDLPSPAPPVDESFSPLGQLAGNIYSSEPRGLESTLFQYQRETVAAMLLRERDGVSIADPLYVPLVGINGAAFFFQPSTFEILKEHPRVSSSRGGILCEELGNIASELRGLAIDLSETQVLGKPL